jgi:hypothetical protein
MMSVPDAAEGEVGNRKLDARLQAGSRQDDRRVEVADAVGVALGGRVGRVGRRAEIGNLLAVPRDIGGRLRLAVLGQRQRQAGGEVVVLLIVPIGPDLDRGVPVGLPVHHPVEIAGAVKGHSRLH